MRGHKSGTNNSRTSPRATTNRSRTRRELSLPNHFLSHLSNHCSQNLNSLSHLNLPRRVSRQSNLTSSNSRPRNLSRPCSLSRPRNLSRRRSHSRPLSLSHRGRKGRLVQSRLSPGQTTAIAMKTRSNSRRR